MKNQHRGSDLLEHPLLLREGIFSSQQAETALGWSPREINPILFRLVKKGKLLRIRQGLFSIQPPGATAGSKGGPAQNWYLIAKAVAGDGPYYISHYSAMHLQGMTSESIQTLFIALAEQRRLPGSMTIPIRFVTVARKIFFGLEEKWVTNEAKVWVSDKERTIIDILDRPELAGGISGIARGIWMVRKELDPGKLIAYAKRFDSFAAAKRLGYLMEKLNLGQAKDIELLLEFTKTSSSYAFLDPCAEKKGRYLHRWRLRIHADAELIEKNLMS